MKLIKNTGAALFSPLSIILAIAAIVLLTAVFLFKGSIIFSPGPLSAQNTRGIVYADASSHADIEQQCELCHQPFKNSQGTSCLQCHQDIAGQIQQKNGLHGLWDDGDSCRSCHSDHKGRNFDMVQDALQTFDHSITKFPLSGNHLLLGCQDCHAQNDFQISSVCADCHAEPIQHNGLFPQDCSECHTTLNWKPAMWQGMGFDHEQFNFRLVLHQRDYQGLALTCNSCHQPNTLEIIPSVCKDCHQKQEPEFIQTHTEEFGLNCIDCHDGLDRMKNFDHRTVFVLDGAHTNVSCQSCHVDFHFKNTPTECSSCHAEPEIHAGSFSLNCAACHTTQAWLPASLRVHTFPLNHGEDGEIDCITCHTQTYAQYTCEGCHESQDVEFINEHAEENIFGDQLMDCVACHWDGETHD